MAQSIEDELGIKPLSQEEQDLGIRQVTIPPPPRQLEAIQQSQTSSWLKGGILDPNISLLDKLKNVVLGQKTDTAGHELQGPGMMEIPGVSSATNYIQHQIDPTESPFYTGIRPLAAGAVKLIGGTLASGFDPRTAGIRASGAVPPRELTSPRATPEVQVPKVTPEQLQQDLPLQSQKSSTLQDAKTLSRDEFVNKHGTASPDRINDIGIDKSGTAGYNLEPVNVMGNDVDKAIVYRDAEGNTKGYLKLGLDSTGKPTAAPQVWVDPELRNQGIATQLYNIAKQKGFDLSNTSGQALTREGAGLFYDMNSKTPAVQKLQQAIADITPLNKQQQRLYSLERSERLGKMKGVTATGEAGYQQQLGTLKGPMEKVSFEPMKLEQPDVDELFDTITNHPASIGYNEIKAKNALAKILSGQVPQQNEIELLGQVFGKDTADSLAQNMPAINRSGGLISDLVNVPKSMMASMDMSAPFRQGLGLAHKKEFWQAFPDMVKAFGSEDAFNAIQDNIVKHPNFQLSQDAGLHLSSLSGLSNREEAFMSNLAERIPIIGKGIRASDRAYTGFLNKLRFDTYSNLVDSMEDAAKSMQSTATNATEQGAAKLANPKTNQVLNNELANFVNTATGRGSLGKLEPSAQVLNNFFFSPRLIASRVRMLNPQTYTSASRAVRWEYIKSLLTIASVGTAVSQLGRLAGGTVEGPTSDKFLGFDSGPLSLPISADAGKVKFGDTRLDPYGGFQQYVVAASRLLSGQFQSSMNDQKYDLGSKFGGQTGLSVAGNFAANKLAPVAKFAYDLLAATKKQPFSFSDESARLFIPMVMQDVLDLAVTNPKLIPTMGPASALGMGVQTYPQPGPVTQIRNLLSR